MGIFDLLRMTWGRYGVPLGSAGDIGNPTELFLLRCEDFRKFVYFERE